MADGDPPEVQEELEVPQEPEVSCSQQTLFSTTPPSVDTEELPRAVTGAQQNDRGNHVCGDGTVSEEDGLHTGSQGMHEVATSGARAEEEHQEAIFMWRRPLEAASSNLLEGEIGSAQGTCDTILSVEHKEAALKSSGDDGMLTLQEGPADAASVNHDATQTDPAEYHSVYNSAANVGPSALHTVEHETQDRHDCVAADPADAQETSLRIAVQDDTLPDRMPDGLNEKQGGDSSGTRLLPDSGHVESPGLNVDENDLLQGRGARKTLWRMAAKNATIKRKQDKVRAGRLRPPQQHGLLRVCALSCRHAYI